METIHIYTDGACSGNPGPGGAAAILIKDGKIFHRVGRGYKNTTNNRMEIKAVTYGIKAAETRLKEPAQIVVHTDSQIVFGALQNNWKRNANKDLWNELDAALATAKTKHQIRYEKAAGHSNDIWNNQADELAVKLRMMPKETLLDDEGYTAQNKQPVPDETNNNNGQGMTLSFKPGDKAWVITRKTEAGGGYKRDEFAYEVNLTTVEEIKINTGFQGGIIVNYYGIWNYADGARHHYDSDKKENLLVTMARDKTELQRLFEEYKARLGVNFKGFYINEPYEGDPRKSPKPTIWK